jgi:hypothetical protein
MTVLLTVLLHCCAHLSRLCGPKQPPETALDPQKSRKIFGGDRSPLPQGECAAFNARLYEEKKKINVLVKECFRAVLPEPVEGMRDRWAG